MLNATRLLVSIFQFGLLGVIEVYVKVCVK
jgi:hypothetical protein